MFGVAPAHAIWQRPIDQILQNIPGTQVILDDIIISGKTGQKHLENLHPVLERLRDYNVIVEIRKYEFFKESITYCGHTIEKHGLYKMPDKIDAIVNAPRPINVTQLTAYLGLLNYYHRFLPNLSLVVWPLNMMLGEERKWRWTEKFEKEFSETKRIFSSDHVLTHYNPQLPMKLEFDKSAYGISAVFSHVMEYGTDRPIGFVSCSLSPAERNYAHIDKEALR